jgi:hypothetical protein
MTMTDSTNINTQPSPVHPAELPTLPVFINTSGTIRTFTPVQEDVEAVQFQGWNNAPRIFKWADGVMFVPRGYDHALRRPNEFESNGQLVVDAPEFLAVKSGDSEFRVDVDSWIVKKPSGEMHIYNHDMFSSTFVETHPMY